VFYIKEKVNGSLKNVLSGKTLKREGAKAQWKTRFFYMFLLNMRAPKKKRVVMRLRIYNPSGEY